VCVYVFVCGFHYGPVFFVVFTTLWMKIAVFWIWHRANCQFIDDSEKLAVSIIRVFQQYWLIGIPWRWRRVLSKVNNKSTIQYGVTRNL